MGVYRSQCQWGSQALLMRAAAVRKKLFLWREVLVLMDLSLLPERGVSKKFVSGVGKVSHSFLVRLRVLEVR